MDELLTATHMYVPICRIDLEKRIIEGQATSDVVDYYDTIFDYESSKRAFEKWRGNIREMHKNEAVGHAIKVIPDDENRRIIVRAHISTGSPNTWEKIKDGTLTGFSIGVPQGKYKSRMVERNGRSVEEYYDHELAEVSVVDNPGSPGCDIAIVRMAGNDSDHMEITDVLDDSEETPELERAATPEPEPEPIERAGARVSHVTQDALHGMRDNQLRSAQSTMQLCGCDECNAGVLALDPDNDGDIDIIPSLDYDSDGGKSDSGMGDYRSVEATITRLLTPAIQRVNLLSAQVAAQKQPQLQTIDTSAIERRLETVESLLSGLVEVRSLLSEVKEQAVSSNSLIERIAAQPQGGGPFANGMAMDKLLATQGHPASNGMSNAEFVQRAQGLGLLNNDNKQVVGASLQIADIINQR